jgi:hypothetical protein
MLSKVRELCRNQGGDKGRRMTARKARNEVRIEIGNAVVLTPFH